MLAVATAAAGQVDTTGESALSIVLDLVVLVVAALGLRFGFLRCPHPDPR